MELSRSSIEIIQNLMWSVILDYEKGPLRRTAARRKPNGRRLEALVLTSTKRELSSLNVGAGMASPSSRPCGWVTQTMSLPGNQKAPLHQRKNFTGPARLAGEDMTPLGFCPELTSRGFPAPSPVFFIMPRYRRSKFFQ
jgi:hypothetical protein